MRLNSKYGIRLYLIILVAGIITLPACRATRSLYNAEIKPITVAGLMSKVEQNAFDYEYFTVRRINCQYSGNNTRVSFNVALKAQRDKAILVSISKFSIPVGSAILTPDSVKIVDNINRNYILDDYTHLSKMLSVELNFEIIQTILSNNAFLHQNDARDFRNFETMIEDGLYLLVEKENRRRFRRFDEDTSVLPKMFFDPTTFTLKRLIVDDKTNSSKMELMFADFEKIEDKNYPSSIDMSFTSPRDKVSLKLKMSGFSNEVINSFTFNIPERYNQLRVN